MSMILRRRSWGKPPPERSRAPSIQASKEVDHALSDRVDAALMYLAFFGIAEKPFAITPDPRYLYLSARHADALAHLVYGINEAGGFIQLTGEVGTGKTTTIRSLLARAPKNAEIALILNPRLSPGEFLLALCEELGLGADDSSLVNTKELVDLLNRYLLRAHAQGRRVVLIVDEAQNLAPEVLEHIRLLTNLETETQKLLQIILIGQPELRKLLAREDLRQLAQRITGRYHLDPLSRQETAAYVRHRMRVAGATADIFTRGALREVYNVSRGIPRVINIICDRALLGAYTQDLHQVPGALVRRAAAEVFDQELSPRWMPLLIGTLAVAGLLGSAVLLWRFAPARMIPGSANILAANTPVPAALAPPRPPASRGAARHIGSPRRRFGRARRGRTAAGHHRAATDICPVAGDEPQQHRPRYRVRTAAWPVAGGLYPGHDRWLQPGPGAGSAMSDAARFAGAVAYAQPTRHPDVERRCRHGQPGGAARARGRHGASADWQPKRDCQCRGTHALLVRRFRAVVASRRQGYSRSECRDARRTGATAARTAQSLGRWRQARLNQRPIRWEP